MSGTMEALANMRNEVIAKKAAVIIAGKLNRQYFGNADFDKDLERIDKLIELAITQEQKQ